MNIYTDNNLKGIINASGRMTKLGVSTISDEVANALVSGGKNYVLIDELYKWAGQKIASLVDVPDVCVTGSASSGIALSVASLFCGNSLNKVHRYKETVEKSKKKDVIVLKGQNVDFGAPIQTILELVGANVKEVGYANKSTVSDIIDNIDDETLAVLFVKSHHCVQKNMVDAKEVIEACNKVNIPIIVDASSEEDLSKYNQMGADFVCYSGAKAISGPTSGFVECSRVEYGDNMRLQYFGIGRAMKIGKENIMGLVKAIEVYQNNNGYKSQVTLDDLKQFTYQINEIDGLCAQIVEDETGRAIQRTKITVDANKYGLSAKELNEALHAYDPGIYTRDHQANIGSISVDPRPLTSSADLDIILNALKKLHK